MSFIKNILLFYQVGSLAIIVAVYLNLTVNTAMIREVGQN